MSKTLEEKISEAVEVIKSVKFEEMELGKHVINDELYLLIQEYESKDINVARYEAHKNYVDIQYVVDGKESIYIAPVSVMEVTEPYSEEKDVVFFENIDRAATAVLTSGGYVILYPEDAHKPGVAVDEPMNVKKIVGKVRI